MRKVNNKERGITLIALVITIIILLILAGVTLTTALGQNGLFQRAKYAGEKYKESETDETEKLEEVEKEIDKITNKENTETPSEPTGGDEKQKTLTVTMTVSSENITDTEIPVSVTVKKEETAVEEGITYTYYLNNVEKGAANSEKTYTYTELTEDTEYTLTVIVKDEEGNWGSATETAKTKNLISFTFRGKTYNAYDDMTWKKFCSSDFNTR